MTKQAHFGSIMGAYDTGLTIVDSLSTLYIMGMTNEFKEAREWIAKSFTLDDAVSSEKFNCAFMHIRYLQTLSFFLFDRMRAHLYLK